MMSFPSGDSAQAALIMGSLYMWTDRSAWSPLLLAIIPATMFGRAYFVCHWALDTIAGASLGATTVLFTDWLIGIEEVTLYHFTQLVGGAIALAVAGHVSGVLPVSPKGVYDALVPPTRRRA